MALDNTTETYLRHFLDDFGGISGDQVVPPTTGGGGLTQQTILDYQTDTFLANGSTTQFTLVQLPATGYYVNVFVSPSPGVQITIAFTITGKQLNFTSAPPLGAQVQVTYQYFRQVSY